MPLHSMKMISFRKQFIRLADFFYVLIFREHLSDGARLFIRNLSWMGFGTFGSTLVTMIFTLLLIRLLGPAEYGKAALFASIGSFMQIPILMNLHNAAARFLSNAKSEKEKRIIISTATATTIFLSILFGAIFFAFSRNLASLLHAELPVYEYGIMYAIAVVFYLLFSGVLRGLGDFRRQSILYFISAFVLILFALYFILTSGRLTFEAFAIPLIVRWLFLALFFFAVVAKYLLPEFDIGIAKEIFKYSFYTLLGSVAIVLVQNIDTMILNYFYPISVVGIFNAYLMASTVVSGKLLDVVAMVAFPMSAAVRDHRVIFARVWRFWKKSFIFLVAGSILTTLLGLLFYGRGYPFSWMYILLFSFQAVLYSIGSIQFWLISSQGNEGAKFSSRHLLIATAINIILNVLLIPKLAIVGASIATIAYGVYLIVISKAIFEPAKIA